MCRDLSEYRRLVALALSMFMVMAIGFYPKPASACETCASELLLQKESAICLMQQIPRYLEEPVDPVIVILTDSCDQEIESEKKRILVDDVIPGAQYKGASDADEKAFDERSIVILSKSHLECLAETLSVSDFESGKPEVFQIPGCASAQ